eukprot:CAMPEP_0183353748 /NCGR_PEP_ID=MMETSP0164_2-20130417/34854_1 /TAXON_ID=221442 /ORGANISM="Coccolithus pelagicus ssp braarudi, Strain PLY182g" /LENGTH=271 /DNA_ID=CAMNT_0025526483 /DNA_START=20 /DNA_END=835 /DNA_ORIENTATION=+
MPKSPAPEPMATSLHLGMFEDALLFSGDLWWMYYVTLVGFCAANARAILGATPKINFFHGCALMVLSCFGGSTLAAIMCGRPVSFVTNEANVSVCLATWAVCFLLPAIPLRLLAGTSIGSVINSATYEAQRCHVLMNCSSLAASALPAALAQQSAGRVPIIGPLIAGLLGGCGGGFMPLNKGLDPLANGTNWRIGSAMLASLWMLLATQYPPSKAAIGLSVSSARCVAVSFFVLVPLVQQATGFSPFGVNPLVASKPAVAKPKGATDKKNK